jgi:hypothetical protein
MMQHDRIRTDYDSDSSGDKDKVEYVSGKEMMRRRNAIKN